MTPTAFRALSRKLYSACVRGWDSILPAFQRMTKHKANRINSAKNSSIPLEVKGVKGSLVL